MRQLIENIKGKDIATAPDGTSQEVTYDFDVYEEMIPAANQAMIPSGLKEIRGRISPACFFNVRGVILQMEDGRKMSLVVTDTRGSLDATPIE